ncbi:hypothetical protein [Glycomyces buryatensis]|uniref:Uncharacterized protein n=1 Tax=Glycomyces buryatensis TaxID=2570927 RepID=A0A4S8QF82_9ACTN|nr:hypothetical protein [Glycomyces buryatensis]THV43068.1 hypothetical protein FAB82_02190 [Glycomyces buryatensis]
MKELLDYPKRVDLPAEMRRRTHLISHTLIQEALGRGWKVSAVVGEMRASAHSRPQRRWPSSDLFRIDAGACELGIQIRDKPKRIPHVDSPDEARRRARGEWVYAHKYDFIPTGLLQLRLYRGTSEEYSWVDNERAPLEDRVEAIVNRIQKATDHVLEIRAQQRLREAEERRRREEVQRQRQRAVKYDSWVGALELMQQRHQRHAELTEFLAALESRTDEVSDSDMRRHFDTFIGWARGHLEATDPLRNPPIPVEDPPDMDFAEWTHWKERLERRAW